MRIVAQAVQVSPDTVRRGRDELDGPQPLEVDRSRAPGGVPQARRGTRPRPGRGVGQVGRPGIAVIQMTPLRWTSKPLRTLRASQLLHPAGYSLHANAKTLEGNQHPDRDTQPRPVDVHDFMDKELGKAIPYGVYDIGPAPAGSTSVPTTRPRRSRSTPCAAGGTPPANTPTPTPPAYWSPPTPAAPTATAAAAPGRPSWPPKPDSPSASATYPRYIEVEQDQTLFAQVTTNWRGRPLESHQTIINHRRHHQDRRPGRHRPARHRLLPY